MCVLKVEWACAWICVALTRLPMEFLSDTLRCYRHTPKPLGLLTGWSCWADHTQALTHISLEHSKPSKPEQVSMHQHHGQADIQIILA